MAEVIEMKNYNEFINKYEDEDFYLWASAGAYVPWFQCTLRCQCAGIGSMSDLDMIICKCVRSGISEIPEISFVLSLDVQLIGSIVANLVRAGIFNVVAEKIEITPNGIKHFSQKSVSTNINNNYNIFMNGITGEWKIIKNESWVEKFDEKVIRFSPLKNVIADEIENNNAVIREIENDENIKINALTLLNDKKILYMESKILFFRDKEKHLTFAVYDEKNDCFDGKTGKHLCDEYDNGQLIEILDLKQEIVKDEQVLEQYDKPIPADKIRFIANEEIRNMFKSIFDKAKKSIFIVSPWIGSFVVNEALKDRFERALKKGIAIKIFYGYTSKDKLNSLMRDYGPMDKINVNNINDRDVKTEIIARNLRKKFEKYTCFEINHVDEGSHEKCLVYDEKYTLVGSLNLLSYDGGEYQNYKGKNFRRESAVLIEDEDFAWDVMSSFFDIEREAANKESAELLNLVKENEMLKEEAKNLNDAIAQKEEELADREKNILELRGKKTEANSKINNSKQDKTELTRKLTEAETLYKAEKAHVEQICRQNEDISQAEKEKYEYLEKDYENSKLELAKKEKEIKETEDLACKYWQEKEESQKQIEELKACLKEEHEQYEQLREKVNKTNENYGRKLEKSVKTLKQRWGQAFPKIKFHNSVYKYIRKNFEDNELGKIEKRLSEMHETEDPMSLWSNRGKMSDGRPHIEFSTLSGIPARIFYCVDKEHYPGKTIVVSSILKHNDPRYGKL